MQAKEVKFFNREELEKILEKNYGARVDLSNYLIFEGKERKIWISSKKVLEVRLEKLKVNSIGLYFGKLKRNEKIHLSPEGSQIVGKFAVKNILSLDEEKAKKFMEGSDLTLSLPKNCEPHNFVIVKKGDDILGCSLALENGIRNLLPKSRRILPA